MVGFRVPEASIHFKSLIQHPCSQHSQRLAFLCPIRLYGQSADLIWDDGILIL